MKLPTVSIDRDGVEVIINKSDYDPGSDILWGEKKKAKPKAETKAAYKDRLIAELAKRGIKKNRRSSIATLEKLLES